jgi:cell division protein FtsL
MIIVSGSLLILQSQVSEQSAQISALSADVNKLSRTVRYMKDQYKDQ